MDENELRQHLEIVKDMIAHPESYGLTADAIHGWSLDNYDKASDILGRIPESLSDELIDCAISAYKEKKVLLENQDGHHRTTE